MDEELKDERLEEINRVVNEISNSNNSNNGQAVASLPIGNGIVARLENGRVKIFTKDNTELFNYGAEACAFEVRPISFLIQIYSIGYARGKSIGGELVKARVRDLLGAEI
jgi:hypothetical protein